MRNPVRYLIIFMAVAVMFMGMAIPAFAGPEGTLVSKINSSRSSAGLAPLETYWDLTDDARAHSSRMMERAASITIPRSVASQAYGRSLARTLAWASISPVCTLPS